MKTHTISIAYKLFGYKSEVYGQIILFPSLRVDSAYGPVTLW